MFEDALLFDQPYRHFLCFDTFTADQAAEMQDVLSSNLDWGVREGSFYVTYRLDLRAFFSDRSRPRFLEEEFLFSMRDRMAEIFDVHLSDEIQVLGHRMIPGQQIGVHNDNPGLGFENYRAITQFTLDYHPEDGGSLNIHTSDSAADVYQSIRPCPNMSFGFETSARSYHSVDQVRNRNRDALIFNFWHVGKCPFAERTIRRVVEDLSCDSDAAVRAVAEIDSGIEAAMYAQELMVRWGFDERAAAAAALLALNSTTARDETLSIRKRLTSGWAAALGVDNSTQSLNATLIAQLAGASMPGDVATNDATLSLVTWIARAPRRNFTVQLWQEVRDKIDSHRTSLPNSARPLADAIFPYNGHAR